MSWLVMVFRILNYNIVNVLLYPAVYSQLFLDIVQIALPTNWSGTTSVPSYDDDREDVQTEVEDKAQGHRYSEGNQTSCCV